MNIHTTIMVIIMTITIYTITIFTINFFLNKKIKQIQNRLNNFKVVSVNHEIEFVNDAIQIAQKLKKQNLIN